MSKERILYVSHLKKYFTVGRGIRKTKTVKAVDDITFSIMRGETLGIVGETGCGKTTVGRTLLQLTNSNGGDVYFNLPNDIMEDIIKTDDQYHKLLEMKESNAPVETELQSLEQKIAEYRKKYSVTNMNRRELNGFRKKAQPVFQDPFGSLDPRKLVKDIIAEPMRALTAWSSEEIVKKEKKLMREIGLSEDHLRRFPHEFSGGQRQRIGIARAISIDPDLLVLDEPTSALDVSIQAQILNILRDLQEQHELTYIFISHHLHVIRMMSNHVAVMYLGKIVELAPTETLFSHTLHPYTKALLMSIPSQDPDIKREQTTLEGDIPSPSNPPTGCYFHTRCPEAMETCGWSPRDMGDSISRLFNKYVEGEELNLPFLLNVGLNQENMEVNLQFEEDLDEGHLSVIKEKIREKSVEKNGVRFRAISDVELGAGKNEVRLKMKPYLTPKLREIKSGHFVSCLLYDGETEGKQNDKESESIPNTD